MVALGVACPTISTASPCRLEQNHPPCCARADFPDLRRSSHCSPSKGMSSRTTPSTTTFRQAQQGPMSTAMRCGAIRTTKSAVCMAEAARLRRSFKTSRVCLRRLRRTGSSPDPCGSMSKSLDRGVGNSSSVDLSQRITRCSPRGPRLSCFIASSAMWLTRSRCLCRAPASSVVCLFLCFC